VAAGFQFPEGPAWGPDGKLYLSSCQTPAVCRVIAQNEWVKYREVGCNGLAFDGDGRLIVCNPDLRGKPKRPRLLRIDKDGREQVLADQFEGRPLNGPNDLVIAADGTIYFTDPEGNPELYDKGAVYRLRPGGRLSRVAKAMRYPNGIALRADGKALLVASTVDKAIYEIALGARGTAGAPRKWCDLAPLGEQVGPDGMALDEKGNLYVAVFGAGMIAKINPSGKVVERLKTRGKNPTNCCFGGKDYQTLYVTETERNELLAAQMSVPGLRPAWERKTAQPAKRR
jgi:gluconolactonase